MGLYLSSNDWVLHEYIKQAFAPEEKTVRKMSPEEFKTVLELREVKKAVNLCMTEMVFTKAVIYKLKINDLMWVMNNFCRIISSLGKQKEFLNAVSAAYSYRKPDADEKKAVEKVIADILKRIEYLNKVPIPENIRLTPIQDYMDLLGADTFIREVKTVFPASKDLYQAQRKLIYTRNGWGHTFLWFRSGRKKQKRRRKQSSLRLQSMKRKTGLTFSGNSFSRVSGIYRGWKRSGWQRRLSPIT